MKDHKGSRISANRRWKGIKVLTGLRETGAGSVADILEGEGLERYASPQLAGSYSTYRFVVSSSRMI
jgi:hypothetical protein